MTLKEFITGCIKVLGLVILMFGLLKLVNHGTLAATLHSVSIEMQRAMDDATITQEESFKYLSRALEWKNKVEHNLMYIPFDLLQIGLGLYLCRKEQRVVRFLLK